MCRCVLGGDACESTAQPPARSLAVASVRLPCDELTRWNRVGGGRRRRDDPYATIAVVEKASAIQSDGTHAGEPRQRAAEALLAKWGRARAGPACPAVRPTGRPHRPRRGQGGRGRAADSRALPGSRRCRRPRSPLSRRSRASAPASAASAVRSRRSASMPHPKRLCTRSKPATTRIEQEREQQQQRDHQDHAAEHRRLRRGEQDRGRRRKAGQSTDQSADRPPASDVMGARGGRTPDARQISRAGSARRYRRPAAPRPRRSRCSARSRFAASRPGTQTTGSRDSIGRRRSRAGRRAPGPAAPPAPPSTSASNSSASTMSSAGGAVGAQPGDQASAQRQGQQHRVEREQEADERADPREQALALVGRRRGDAEESHVEVGRLDVQAVRRQSLQAGPHLELGGPAAPARRCA